jgi:hypothetical protein
MSSAYIFHWLPIADNMLPDIRDNLEKNKLYEIGDIIKDNDEIRYSVRIPYGENLNAQRPPTLKCEGRINKIGFSQVQLPFTKDDLSKEGSFQHSLLVMIKNIEVFVKEFIYDIMPMAVKNKLAVLKEEIKSFEQFHTTDFKPSISEYAKQFIDENYIAILYFDKDFSRTVLNINLTEYDIEMYREAESNEPHLSTSDKKTIAIFYSTNELIEKFNNELYHVSALEIVLRFGTQAMKILKKTRDHVVPLRRKLALALQKNTEEHFDDLTRIKKYLAYINIKLPVIQKVVNHLESLSLSDQYQPTEVFLDKIADSLKVDYVKANINNKKDGKPFFELPRNLINKYKKDIDRLPKLYEEVRDELIVLSTELSKVLEATLISQELQISYRHLDTSQNILELNRAGKNRDNALKTLSVILALNVAYTFVKDFTYSASNFFNIGISLLIMIIGLFSINYSIKRRSSLFRIVIPLKFSSIAQNLNEFVNNHKEKKLEDINNGINVITWYQKFRITENYKNVRIFKIISILNVIENLIVFVKRIFKKTIKFDFTIEYEKRGYIHSITLEKEHFHENYDINNLVFQVFEILEHNKCLTPIEKEKSKFEDVSLFAGVMTQLGLEIDPLNKGLNIILSLTNQELKDILIKTGKNSPDDTIDEDVRVLIKYIRESKKDDYIKWFMENSQKGSEYGEIVGLENILHKKEILKKHL